LQPNANCHQIYRLLKNVKKRNGLNVPADTVGNVQIAYATYTLSVVYLVSMFRAVTENVEMTKGNVKVRNDQINQNLSIIINYLGNNIHYAECSIHIQIDFFGRSWNPP